MRYLKYLKEDIISQALNIDEPEVGGEYPSEKVKRYIEIIDKALNAMKNKEESDANDSIVQDLRDKKKKWQNVDKETKPTKTKTELPPEDNMDNEPPPQQQQQQESTIKKLMEGKLRLGKSDSKAFKIVSFIQSWPSWYYSDVPQKTLINDLMKEFKIDKSKSLDILKIRYDFSNGKINLGDFQDFTHMVLQGQKYTQF